MKNKLYLKLKTGEIIDLWGLKINTKHKWGKSDKKIPAATTFAFLFLKTFYFPKYIFLYKPKF